MLAVSHRSLLLFLSHVIPLHDHSKPFQKRGKKYFWMFFQIPPGCLLFLLGLLLLILQRVASQPCTSSHIYSICVLELSQFIRFVRVKFALRNLLLRAKNYILATLPPQSSPFDTSEGGCISVQCTSTKLPLCVSSKFSKL